MTTEVDALVIGGGPAGSTAAILLANAGWSVALFERARFPRRKVCGEFISSTTFPLLRRLGVAARFLELAGPEVRRLGLFTGNGAAAAVRSQRLPAGRGWGRALGREVLDTMLLDAARAAGATVWESWQASHLTDSHPRRCTAIHRDRTQSVEIHARVVIAAHGSWEPGPLPTQMLRPHPRESDLFGFKAHLVDCDLPDGLMPLLAFPDGYGGMVHTDQNRVSLSCCIRRRRLEDIRRGAGAASAAEALFSHIKGSSREVREVVSGARLEGAWMSAGPIRPGIRRCAIGDTFLIGNAAGEAHPVIAEGITMAMQSAELLCDRLGAETVSNLSGPVLAAVTSDYGAAWRRNFASRIYAAACIAEWAMRPWAVRCSLPLLTAFPSVLTAGARVSGKAA